MVGFKQYGGAFQLRFFSFFSYFDLVSMAGAEIPNYILQLKYGSSSLEDHQFVRGIPIYAISEVLDKILSGSNGPPLLINGIKRPMPLVRILEAELYPTLLSKARSFGLSDDWIQVLFSLIIIIFELY